jgi:hypothetical protein
MTKELRMARIRRLLDAERLKGHRSVVIPERKRIEIAEQMAAAGELAIAPH